VTSIDRDRIILAKIGWSEHYSGLEGTDEPRGKFEGLRRGGPGNEAFNFKRAADGLNYGYFRANRGRLRLKRIYDGSTGGVLGGVTVIWVSKPPDENGLRAVGWYRNATVFDSEMFGPWSDQRYVGEESPEGKCRYICSAPADESVCLSVAQRETWKLPEAVTRRMRRTNVLHPHVGGSAERALWVNDMESLIDRIESFNPDSPPHLSDRYSTPLHERVEGRNEQDDDQEEEYDYDPSDNQSRLER
jgi:hypothetical protein